MCFFNLVKKHDAVRFPSYPFTELSALLESYISRRSSDESGHIELLHIFAHIKADHILFRVEKVLCKRLGELGLSHSCRTEEQEGSDRFVRVLDAGPVASDCTYDLVDRLLLTYDSAAEHILHFQELASFAFRDSS